MAGNYAVQIGRPVRWERGRLCFALCRRTLVTGRVDVEFRPVTSFGGEVRFGCVVGNKFGF